MIIKAINKGQEILFWALSLFLPLSFVLVREHYFIFIYLYFFVLGLFLLWLVGKNSQRITVNYASLDLVFLGYLFICFLSIFSAAYGFNARNEFFRLSSYFLIFYLAGEMISTEEQIKKISIILLLGAGLVAGTGIYQYLQKADIEYGVSGTLFNANIFSGYLVLVLPLSLVNLLSPVKKIKLLSIFLSGLLLVCLILTRSVGGIIGIYISILIIYYWLTKSKYILKTKPLLRKLISAYVILSSLYLLLLFIFKFKQPNLFNRLDWWQAALKMVLAHPFRGVGLGCFAAVYLRYKVGAINTLYAHNYFLQIAAETGIVALGMFLWLVKKLFREGISEIGQANSFLARFRLGALAGLGGVLVHNLINIDLCITANAGLFWLLAGIVIGKRNRVAEVKNKWRFNFITMSLVIISAVMMISNCLGGYYFYQGLRRSSKNQFPEAIYCLERSLKLDSERAPTYAFLSGLYEKEQNEVKAIDYLKKAISLNPYYPPFYHNLALLYEKNQDLDQAIQMMEKAVNAHQQRPWYHYQLGLLYKQKDLRQEAEKEYLQAIKLLEQEKKRRQQGK